MCTLTRRHRSATTVDSCKQFLVTETLKGKAESDRLTYRVQARYDALLSTVFCCRTGYTYSVLHVSLPRTHLWGSSWQEVTRSERSSALRAEELSNQRSCSFPKVDVEPPDWICDVDRILLEKHEIMSMCHNCSCAAHFQNKNKICTFSTLCKLILQQTFPVVGSSIESQNSSLSESATW